MRFGETLRLKKEPVELTGVAYRMILLPNGTYQQWIELTFRSLKYRNAYLYRRIRERRAPYEPNREELHKLFMRLVNLQPAELSGEES